MLKRSLQLYLFIFGVTRNSSSGFPFFLCLLFFLVFLFSTFPSSRVQFTIRNQRDFCPVSCLSSQVSSQVSTLQSPHKYKIAPLLVPILYPPTTHKEKGGGLSAFLLVYNSFERSSYLSLLVFLSPGCVSALFLRTNSKSKEASTTCIS